MDDNARPPQRSTRAGARALLYLRERTGLATSDVVRASIEHYYEAVRAGTSAARRDPGSIGFVASGKGPADLSDRYKEHLTASLNKKHP